MKSVSKEKYLLHTKFETARTILAFLCREKLNEVAELFIKTCPYLEFERNAIEEGYAPFNFAYQPISEILHDYSQMGRKLSQLVQRYGCDLSFQRSMTDLEKIEYLLEFQSNRTTFVPDNAAQSGENATGVPQNVTIGQTLTTNQEMFSQHPDGGTYPQNETVSFMIIPDYDGSGPGVSQYSQGATVSTVDNYTMSAASNPSVYSETPAVIPNEGSNEPVPTHYVLYDDNGNEQQIMIELIPEENNSISGPHDATQTIQTTPSNGGFQAPQCPTSSYSMPSIQTEHAEQPLHHSISVGETLSMHTNSNTANGNQYHLPAQENNQLLMVSSHQVQQVQGQIQTMNLGEQVTTGSVAGCIDVQSAGQQENMNDGVTRKPYHNPPQSTVTVTTTINQQKVVTRLQDIRRSLCMERPALTDTVSSTTPQKPPRIPTVPVPCQSRNITKKAAPSSAIRKSKAAIPTDMVENPPTPNVGNSTVSTEAGPTIDPAVSALEEWKRIRSTNRSNFDNIVREEISRDIDQQDQEKSIQMRERKKAALRLAKLRKKMVKTDPPEQQADPACETSAKPAARKTKQRTRAAAAKREVSGLAEQPNSTKSAARKRKQRAVTAKRTKRSSIETVANANDSLEKNAALLEAALYTPMKLDTEQPEEQQQQKQQQPMESGNKKLGTPVPQTVSFTLTPAQQLPTEAVASVLENQTEALPREKAYQTVQQEPEPQPVDCALALDTSVTNPSSEVKENVNITVAQHNQPTPSVPMDTAPHDASESPLKSSPPAAHPETAESRAEACATQAQDETAQAVASITALAPTTPCKVKVVPIARKHLSNRKRSASSDTSSSDSSSDSDSNSSCSSSSSSTTMEEDENIRQMYENTKRYRNGKRIKQPSAPREQAAAIVASKSPRKHNVIRIHGVKASETNKPQNGTLEPGGVGENGGGSDSLKTAVSDGTTATLSRIKVVTNRQQSTVKLAQPKPQQAKQGAKQRLDPKSHSELTFPMVAPQTVPVQSAPTKKVKSPTPTEKAAVATPSRTKTPRKQQLIPTKLDSNDTFMPPTSPPVPQRPAQKSPQRPVRNRYAPARLPSALSGAEKLKGTKVQRAQKADAQRVEAGPLEQEEQTVDDKQQENAPVNVVVPVPTKTMASSPKVVKPEATVCQDAIYAVLAQIHGK